jgi:hypothetical protein
MRALGAGDLVLTLRVSMYVGPFDEWAETGISGAAGVEA